MVRSQSFQTISIFMEALELGNTIYIYIQGSK